MVRLASAAKICISFHCNWKIETLSSLNLARSCAHQTLAIELKA